MNTRVSLRMPQPTLVIVRFRLLLVIGNVHVFAVGFDRFETGPNVGSISVFTTRSGLFMDALFDMLSDAALRTTRIVRSINACAAADK